MLSEGELKRLGEMGVIAAPGEDEEAFVKRFDTLEEARKKGAFEKWHPDYRDTLGVRPHWIPLTYSNRGLTLWQGAAVWIDTLTHVPLIQLRKGFKKGRFLFYSKQEVLMHETLHAIRMGFNEPQFEEILAYYHSPSKWRQFFGPLFRTPRQTLFFIFLLLIALVSQVIPFFYLSPFFISYLRVFPFLPLIDLVFRSAVLIKDRRLLKKALKNLAQIFPNQKNVFPIALRLKDSEIQQFALQPIGELLQLIDKKSSGSLRWRQILAQFY